MQVSGLAPFGLQQMASLWEKGLDVWYVILFEFMVTLRLAGD